MEQADGSAAQEIVHCGRRFARDEIALITQVVGRFGKLSRCELAATVCELVSWRRARGGLKARECLDLLEKLEARGLLTLPALRKGRPRGRKTSVGRTTAGEPRQVLTAKLAELMPVELEVVEGPRAQALWRELVGRYHYLGYATPFGSQLRYFVRIDRAGPQVIGCLQYSSAAWRLGVRERWIGWSEKRRSQHLAAVVQQSRFLLLPWVRVEHLASHVLALSTRRLVADWERRCGGRPFLVETLVDVSRFGGTCYRAANWIDLGLTAGRGRMDREHRRHGQAPKRVFVYPLHPRARQMLSEGSP